MTRGGLLLMLILQANTATRFSYPPLCFFSNNISTKERSNDVRYLNKKAIRRTWNRRKLDAIRM